MSDLRQFSLFINGAFCAPVDGIFFDSIDPATGHPWARIPAAGEQDVNRAVAAARSAFEQGDWASMTRSQRGRLLYRLADLIEQHAPELAELETRDTGKIIRETTAQTAYAAEFYRYYAGLADKEEGAVLPIDKAEMEVFTRREPLGVVAAIVPWNSQLFLSAVKLGPALAAGNTVVLKASEEGPAPLLKFAELIREVGFPPGVVNIITGFGEPCGRALTSHPDIARVAFTGGPEAARHVVANTANNFAVTTLELGGKSPVLVFEDADQTNALNAVMAGIFGASGQSCVAGSRLFVQKPLFESFTAKLADRANRIRIGDPMAMETEMGPLATERQRAKIEAAVAATVSAGGRLLVGGSRPSGREKGWYYQPTILACDDPALPTMAEEMFGPVLSVMPFTDEADAVAKANDSKFGLAAGLFTNSVGRTHRLSRKIRSGILWVNTYRAVSPVAPFGGFGHSGFGREGGMEAMRDYTRPKTVWINCSDEPMPDPFVMR
ncbi:aldehyde dehydrogenase [Aestuariispira insulae]|uniref:Aldehyde dehydrogenase (NAD+)/betaine-aldehyde dehydrogenase n=1 Tax=Aestuariispira insulae TaxID=1461337 RepID=A0A3D9H5M0_9PROT|nr:aldehyde dehydrogenase [Aestuariispira insulae]RED44813.1 aldehyde dehydrogenase (NAD+)/betaine-aldehyde dehydrogenase [Aestuariispira insulae]